ncbi:MAG: prealbumin-like fold domain-containing protein [Oscillospiraceae bacterium]|nr:prealbumin-like fold domain-containing protein [Oscillospiraceae bacterium]
MTKQLLNKLTSMALVMSMVLSLVVPAAGAEYAPEESGEIPVSQVYEAADQTSDAPASAKPAKEMPEAVVAPKDPESPAPADAPERALPEAPELPEELPVPEPAAPAEEPAEDLPEEAPEGEEPAPEALPEELPEAPEEEEQVVAPEEEEELPYRTLTVQAARLPVADENQNPVEPILWSSTMWNRLYGRIPEFSAKNDSVTVEITGSMPETVTAQARFVGFAEAETHPEVALFLLEAELRYPDGTAYVPEEELQVTVASEGLLRAALDGKAFLAYSDEAYDGTGREGDVGILGDFSVRSEWLAYTENEYTEPIRFQTAGLLDTTVLGTVKFTEAASRFRFLLSGQQGLRNLNAKTENGTAVTVTGPFSGSVFLQADAAADVPAGLEGETIAAVNLSLTDINGISFLPETLVTVTLSDPAIAEAVQNGAEPAVWSVTAEGTAVPVSAPYFYGDSVVFSAKNILAFCVTVPVKEEPEPENRAEEKPESRTLTATDNLGYEVTVVCPPEAEIPENAELVVTELAEGTAEYDSYVERAAGALNKDAGTLASAHALDIRLVNPESGEHYQPSQDLKVSIRLLQEELGTDDAVSIVHFESAPVANVFSANSKSARRTQAVNPYADKPVVLGTTVLGDTIEFETDGFSVYVVLRYTVETYYKDSEGETWHITATYGPDTGLPEDVELKVTELTAEESEGYLAETAEALGKAEKAVKIAKAFDISFEKDGTVYHNLNGDVEISIELLDQETADELRVVHFASDGQKVEALDSKTAGNTVSFASNEFSVYVVVEVTVTQIITASDGNDYLVAVTYDNDSGVPMDAQLEVSELAADTEEYQNYVNQAAETLGKEAAVFAFAHAFDISLIDPATGDHCEPIRPVAVSVRLLNEDVQDGDAVNVVHFAESGAEALAANAVDGAVEFESASFSVYVVSSDQRGYIFKFLSPEQKEYTQLRQTVFDGDVLVEPVAPSEFGRVFEKWIWKGMEGTDADYSDFSYTYNAAAPQNTPFMDANGKIIVPNTQRGMKEIEVTASFTDENNAQYHILFNDQDENIYNQITYRTGTRVDPNGVENAANKASYVVVQKKTGQYLTFSYWTEDLYDLDQNTGKPKPFQPEDISRDISLYPYCPQAHWLHFDVNKAQAGGQSLAFVSPKVILEGEVPTSADVPTADGYVFNGWWTKAAGDASTNCYQIYDSAGALVPASETRLKPGSSTETFEYEYELRLYTGGDSLDYDPTLYAHWTAVETSTYTVGYYVQNPDNPNEYQFRMLHETAANETYVGTGTVGETIGLPTSDADIKFNVLTLNQFATAAGLEAAGLTLNTEKSEKVTISPDGNTAFKVYFDRKEFTLSFWSDVSNGHGSGTNKASITALYGAYIADQWPKNKNDGVQWLFCTDTNSNKMTIFTMPAENIEFTDNGVSTGRSWERLVHLQNIADDLYGDSNNAYTDTRTTAAGGTYQYNYQYLSMQIYANVSTMIQIPGFDLVQIVGSNQQASNANINSAKNKTWVKAGETAPYSTNGLSVTNDGDEVLYFYRKNNNTGQADLYFKRHTQPLTIRYKVDGRWATDITLANTSMPGATVVSDGSGLKWDSVKFDSDLSNYLYDYTSDHANLGMIKDAETWWFWDEGLTQAAQPSDIAKMPDRPIVLYMGLRTRFAVNIDPQGGEMDGMTQSTWFNVGKDESVAEYTISRDYVAWNEMYESKSAIPESTKLYKYVYNTRTNNDGTRSAKYVEMTAEERADDSITAYVYYPGLWQFQYWYEEGHPNTPFDFVTPPNRPITILAKWVHAGTYSIVYNADNGGKSYRIPKDPELYLEGSQAVIKASVDQPGDKQFRFWATAAQTGDSMTLPSGVEKFLPNERLTIDVKYTPGQLEQTERTITLYAWYEGGAFTSDSFADYEFYLPESNGTWLDGQPEGEENIPYYKQTISPGETLIMPVLPTGTEAPTGIFIGWYEEPEFKTRFTGFGEISTPINTKLYARYAEVHTVTYKELATTSNPNPRTISVQTYFDGELLSTLGVEFTTTSDQYVAWWAGDNNINYAYMGKGVELSNKGTGYDSASDEVKKGRVKGDIVLTPVTENVYNLSFDAQGGSYVAPIEMPHDYTRWVAEPLTTRDAFRFDGWFTAPAGQTNDVYPGVEGGVQYKFDKPLTTWAADPDGDSSTTTEIDLTRNNPLRLYAHWTPTGDPIPTTVKINYWIQNTDRTGYFLWDSETVSEHGKGSKAGEKIAVNELYELTDAQKSTAKIAGYETFPDNDSNTDDQSYFVLSSANSGEDDDFVSYKTEESKTAAEGGVTTLNVYFNRKLYTLIFQPDGSVTKNQKVGEYETRSWGNYYYDHDAETNVTYSADGKIAGNESYSIANTWLGADVSSLWPANATVNSTSYSYTAPSNYTSGWETYYYRDKQKASFDATLYFTGWTEYNGTSTTDKTNTFNNVAASQAYVGKTLLPNAAQTTYTLRGQYQADTNPATNKVTVHYMLLTPGKAGASLDDYYEAPDYEQTIYGISGNPSSYSAATWNTIYSQATPIDGYTREDGKSRGEVISGGSVTYYPLYTYHLPADVYYHRFGSWGNLLYAEIFLEQNQHNGNSTNGDGNHLAGRGVREGQYSLWYSYLVTGIILRPYYLSNTDTAYIFRPGELTHNTLTARGAMSVTDLKAMLEENKTLTGWDQVVKNEDTTHVYLYHTMQCYPLTLMSAETGGTLKTATVQYSKYLTNEDGTLGYIRQADGLNYTPPAVPGRSFAYWSQSKDSTAAWEGVMPNQPFILWAHYEDTKVTVTALGVQANGSLRRGTDAAKTIVRDANGLPASWEDDGDENPDTKDFVSEKKAYGTRFQEFELPIPSLESGEIFYGWKRVENGKMVGGYLSNTQTITGDITVAPDITVNKGGVLAYYANGATNEGLTTETKYGEDGFLFEEGNYYFGATAKAKFGTVSGGTLSATNLALKKGEFEFVCWNTKADGGGDSYYPGDAVTLPNTGEVKLYAQYSNKREITLVYHINVPSDYLSDTSVDQNEPGFVKLPLENAFNLDMVDVGLNGKTDKTGIEREDTHNNEKVLKIIFKDYLEDSVKYPNSEYPCSQDSEGNAFTLYCPGHTFLHWNTFRDGSDETALRTDKVRINTLGKDANGEIHLYAQWESVVLTVQVYEVIPNHLEDQFRLRAVSNTGSATHIDAEGHSSTVTTDVNTWGNPYNSFLKSNSDRSESAINTAVAWYMADVRHGVDPKDTYLKTVLYSPDPAVNETEIRFVRFDSTNNVWQYATTENETEVTNVPDGDWKNFNLGDELKIYYQRPQYMVYFNYNGGTDADGAEYIGESAETKFTGSNTAEMKVISEGITRNGFVLVGWNMTTKLADLAKDDPLPTGNAFYAVDPDDSANNAVIPLTKSGSGETLRFDAGSGTTMRLYQAYTDSQNAGSIMYAVWRVTPWVCQFTDGGTLLYYNSGTDRNPVYVQAKFSSIKAAYNAMGKLYSRSETEGNYTYTPYSAKFADADGKDTRLEMLVREYVLQSGEDFIWGTNANTYYKLTWTTEPAVLAQDGPCVIQRGAYGTNHNLGYCHMTLKDITFDNNGKGSSDGGIWDLKYNNTTGKSVLILESGSTLQNAVASGHGGAVDVENGELIMNDGALIQNCDGNTLGGGAVYLHTKASFVMNGGRITDCKSARGGAVYCSADNASFTMNGGLITGCSAEGHGSVIYTENHVTVTLTGGTITGNTVSDTYRAFYLGGADCRMHISGNPVIYDNVTSSGQQRNIDISSVTANTVTKIITVNGALSADSRIGVYAPTGHDAKGQDFGNYLDGISKDNFDIFKNDKNIYLVGMDGGSNKLVWGPVICKIVETKTEGENTVKVEHVFSTLNAAVAYARANGNGAAMSATNPVKIEMLVDYEIPETDSVTLGEYTVTVNGTQKTGTDNIILTTAPTNATYTGETFLFRADVNSVVARTTTDSDAIAILVRGYDSASLFTVSGSAKLELTNITMDGNKASYQPEVDGGIVNVQAGTLNIQSGATMRNSSLGSAVNNGITTKYSGGAVYVAGGSIVNMTGGTITGNSASANGAGIYLAPYSLLKLSGGPSFGGPDQTIDGTLGNYVLKTSGDTGFNNPTNGGKEYPNGTSGNYLVRQDIYIAGYLGETSGSPNPATSLYVTGALTDPLNSTNKMQAGSIWVWAQIPNPVDENNHYQQLKQFAVFTDTLLENDRESSLKAFRNAAPDEITENGTDSYLTGTIEGELTVPDNSPYAGYIYWTGISGYRKVVLRKVDTNYTSVAGATFNLYKGNSSSIYVWKDRNDKTKTLVMGKDPASGKENLTSLASGMIWTGELPYGTYYLQETSAPNTANVGKWFCLIVDETGLYMSRKGYTETEVYIGTAKTGKEAALADAEALKANS